MDDSDILECINLLEEIYREYPFSKCSAYMLLNNILLIVLQKHFSICIHCERDVLENIIKSLFYIVEKNDCSTVCIIHLLLFSYQCHLLVYYYYFQKKVHYRKNNRRKLMNI